MTNGRSIQEIISIAIYQTVIIKYENHIAPTCDTQTATLLCHDNHYPYHVCTYYVIVGAVRSTISA